MGIRFHCPNGHKLNVKSFLAGKKGVCPDCGVKLRIPERSEPGLDSGIDEENRNAKLPAPAPTPVATAPAPMAPLASPAGVLQPAVMPHVALRPLPGTQATPAAGYAAQPMPGAAPLVMQPPPYAAPGAVMPPARMPQPPPPPGGVAADPITESPLATWFVRPPSGGQFGPARGEVMRKWLTEGRVTADSLVWREGWTDWQAATEVFPALGKPANAVFGAASSPTKSTATPIVKKKSDGALGAALLVFLLIVCVVLVVVLAVVLSGGLGST